MKMKLFMCLLTMSLGVITVQTVNAAEHPSKKKSELKEQTSCPVMGSKINKALFVDKAGKRIYVCCKGCLAPVKKNFSKFEKKITAQGQKITKVPTKMKDIDNSGHTH